MAARVVGDHAMAGSLQGGGAHHDVAAGGGEAVEQHDRDTGAAVAGFLAGQGYVVGADLELLGRHRPPNLALRPALQLRSMRPALTVCASPTSQQVGQPRSANAPGTTSARASGVPAAASAKAAPISVNPT